MPHSIIKQCNICKEYHEYKWNEFSESYHGYCDEINAFVSIRLEDVEDD